MIDTDRQKFHFEPKKGWMNDPNGLIYFNGRYHAFFQHNPYHTHWAQMHWGHAVSDDLIHWEELPIALSPEMPYENTDGCFSGSAIVKDSRLYLFYTAVGNMGQVQAMAYSDDGLTFHKYENNPIIPACPLGNKDFRDPKVFIYEGKYHMVVGSGNSNVGQVLLFKSEDLINWSYSGILYQSKDLAPCAECPDLFPLGDKYVLTVSKMRPMLRRCVLSIIGDFDGSTLNNPRVVQTEQPGDFYAPQTFEDKNGERIMIGWLWHMARVAKKSDVSAGTFSIPRVLSLEGGTLRNYPCETARELLTSDSPFVKVTKRNVYIVNGAVFIARLNRSPVNSIEVLEDTKTVEVFINKGERSYSFYKGII